MRSGNLVSGPGFAFIINAGHSLIGGADYLHTLGTICTKMTRKCNGEKQTNTTNTRLCVFHHAACLHTCTEQSVSFKTHLQLGES